MASVNTYVREYFTEEYNILEIISSSEDQPQNYVGKSNKKENGVGANGEDPPTLTDQEIEEKAEKSKQESIRRTKRDLKFLVYNNVLSNWRFATLTYAGKGEFSRDQVFRNVEQMVERIEEKEKRDIQYICALELHPGGHGYHAHLVIDIPYYKNEYFQKMFWRKGFVKLEKLRIGKNPRQLSKVVSYLIKYVTKSIENGDKGKKRYSSSRNLIRQPFRISLNIQSDTQFYKLIQKYKKKGYREIERYDFIIEDIEYTVTIFHRSRPTGPGLTPDNDFCNRLLNAFGGTLLNPDGVIPLSFSSPS